jgi:RNA polymerase subunit RPABC4/transcription elongation factor Spt4
MSDPLAVKDITEVDNKTILECYKKEFTEESIEKILDALRPHGKWIKHDFPDCDGFWDYKCSECEKVYGGEYNFCPNCGAKMDGEEADNETN